MNLYQNPINYNDIYGFYAVRPNFNILEWDISLAGVTNIIIGNQPIKSYKYYLWTGQLC